MTHSDYVTAISPILAVLFLYLLENYEIRKKKK